MRLHLSTCEAAPALPARAMGPLRSGRERHGGCRAAPAADPGWIRSVKRVCAESRLTGMREACLACLPALLHDRPAKSQVGGSGLHIPRLHLYASVAERFDM